MKNEKEKLNIEEIEILSDFSQISYPCIITQAYNLEHIFPNIFSL